MEEITISDLREMLDSYDSQGYKEIEHFINWVEEKIGKMEQINRL